IAGERDTNVPPESTMRVVDALIKANKDFELVVVPGMGHSNGGAYGTRRMQDFFVKHLQGVEPPNRNAERRRAGEEAAEAVPVAKVDQPEIAPPPREKVVPKRLDLVALIAKPPG